MKFIPYLFITLLLLSTVSMADETAPPLEVLRYGPVNDLVIDAVPPGGLVKTTSGDLLTTFTDKGDSAAGSRCYLVRSKDEGVTWSAPYKIFEPNNPREGLFTELVTLPDDSVLLLIIRIAHTDTSPESVFAYRESTVELQRSEDNGETFQPVGFLPTAPKALTSTTGDLYTLPNGNLIIPAYCYTTPALQHPGYHYGAGFFRSQDGGNHWGPLEVAFQDPPSEEETRQGFNEAAFVVRDDGMIIAYARVDVHQGADFKLNHMWRTQSTDNGVTWTPPEETGIVGIYPTISTLPSGEFVMACGIRDSPIMRRTTSLFTSSDGLTWTDRGHPYYSRSNGLPANSATGGSQDMVALGDNTLYIVFYAYDPALPGINKTYIDGNVIRLE